MKLSSYNILQGCFDSYKRDAKLTDRFEYLKKSVREINADFIGLADTFRWKEYFSPKELQKHFEYQYIHSIDMNDVRVDPKIGITIMSNLPIKEVKNICIETRECLKATVMMGSQKVDIFTVYLDDLKEDVRLKQVQKLLEYVDFNRPTVIMGDLNTFSRKDLNYIEADIKYFSQKYPEISQKLLPIINDMKRGEVIDLLQRKGFKDIFDDFRPTMPSLVFPDKIEKPFLRLDYGLYHGNLSVRNAIVHKGDPFDKTSDHYPLSFDVEIM